MQGPRQSVLLAAWSPLRLTRSLVVDLVPMSFRQGGNILAYRLCLASFRIFYAHVDEIPFVRISILEPALVFVNKV